MFLQSSLSQTVPSFHPPYHEQGTSLCKYAFQIFLLQDIVRSTFQLFIKLEMSGRELSFVSRNSFSTVESDKHMPATLFDILCFQTLNFHTCAECR